MEDGKHFFGVAAFKESGFGQTEVWGLIWEEASSLFSSKVNWQSSLPALNLSDMQVAVSMDTVDHRKSAGSWCSIYVYNRTYLQGHWRPGSIQFDFINRNVLEKLEKDWQGVSWPSEKANWQILKLFLRLQEQEYFKHGKKQDNVGVATRLLKRWKLQSIRTYL